MADPLDNALRYAREFGMTDRDIAVVVQAEAERRRFERHAAGSVTLVHPDLPGQPLSVAPDAVEVYERSGWQVDTPAEAAPEPESEPAAEAAENIEEN